jgi:hypothetical protein
MDPLHRMAIAFAELYAPGVRDSVNKDAAVEVATAHLHKAIRTNALDEAEARELHDIFQIKLDELLGR